MTIRVDTREKAPWSFPEGTKTVVGTVHQGDYAVEGDNTFAIERKSLKDFRNTVVREWDRFCRELHRMDLCGFATKVVIVEGNFSDYCFLEGKDGFGVEYPSCGDDPVFTPQMAAMRVAELLVWHRCAVLFAQDEGIAAAMAFQILLQRNEQLKGMVRITK